VEGIVMTEIDRGGHAVVIGAGIAGLLAARVLAERFARVSVIDRGEPAGASAARDRHAHLLPSRGCEALEGLFPGLIGELAALGAARCDLQGDCAWYHGGRRLHPAPSRLRGLAVSRPRLREAICARVEALPGVRIRFRCEAVGLLPEAGGVRVQTAGGRAEIPADLVVNASGRDDPGIAWLRELGCAPPVQEHAGPGPVCVSREYRAHPGDADADVIAVMPGAEPRGGLATRAEGGRWLITVLGAGEDALCADPDAYEAFAARLPIPDIHRLMLKLDPVGPPQLTRPAAGVRRRYERLRHLPGRYVAVGDALCHFGPCSWYDVTVAACQALVLREALREGTADAARRFFAKAAEVIDAPWALVTKGSWLGCSTPPRLRNAYFDRLHAAAEADPVVGDAVLRVAALAAPPRRLLAPGMLARVLRRRPEWALPVHPCPVPAEDMLPLLPGQEG